MPSFTPVPCVPCAKPVSCVKLGFSLVELSIVLVILGLLVGGILTGRSLIRASELRALSAQHQQFYTAIQTFKQKYLYLPGDLPNATNFWGLAGGTTAPLDVICNNVASTDTKTCNGDGNGVINVNTGEENRFWQHLSNAGLIPGQYTGAYMGGTLPANRISPGGTWWLRDLGTSPDIGWVGYYGPTLTAWGNGDYLKPEELYNIDVKTDDGKPALGKIVGFSYNPTADVYDLSNYTTTTDRTVITANYKLNSSVVGCQVMFRQQF